MLDSLLSGVNGRKNSKFKKAETRSIDEAIKIAEDAGVVEKGKYSTKNKSSGELMQMAEELSSVVSSSIESFHNLDTQIQETETTIHNTNQAIDN